MNGFIIGTGRCGTTLLASILDAHSDVCVPPETQLLFQYRGNGAGLHEIVEAGVHFKAGAADYIDFVQKRCPHDLRAYFDYERYLEGMSFPVATLKLLMGEFYAEIAKAKGKSVCLEQTPWYGLGIDILNELYPQARYIHMVRDGRDVAISFARTPWWHKDVGRNLARWAVEASAIATSCEQMLRPEQVLTVRYEDFVQDPERELRKICVFLQIAYEPRMLEPGTATDYRRFHKSDLNEMLSPAYRSWSEAKTSPVFKGSVGAWETYGGHDFSQVPQDVQQCLERFGYAA
ncbi:sulfotransferase family protein [Trinickia fusca]|uniref:Sulfotransferase n=1 Tax=Trinickia fusca TaxID=2419777 RepID=A0A494XJJ2_9BURK|nr:sulfotransferase [Trinickia fusca]RKP50830.1 sulfotransferase [Trinickia fusca]